MQKRTIAVCVSMAIVVATWCTGPRTIKTETAAVVSVVPKPKIMPTNAQGPLQAGVPSLQIPAPRGPQHQRIDTLRLEADEEARALYLQQASKGKFDENGDVCMPTARGQVSADRYRISTPKKTEGNLAFLCRWLSCSSGKTQG